MKRGDGAAARTRQVVREIGDGVGEPERDEALLGHRGAGIGDGGDEDARVRAKPLQLADDGNEAEDVARRGAVQPHARARPPE